MSANKKIQADIPAKALMERYLRLQNLRPKEPVLERLMLTVETHHDFAALFLAIWERDGREPTLPLDQASNTFIRASLALAHEIRDTMLRVGKRAPSIFTLSIVENCQWKLTTKAYDHENGTSFIETPPSDNARREAVEKRKKDGSTHVGARLVRRKERCLTFDQRMPKHW